MIQQIYPSVAHSYIYELNKDFQFAAAHYIPHSEAGKCQNMHGHTYFVNVTIAGDILNDSGFLINFAELKKIIHNRFDHKVLNEDLWFKNNEFPTTEVLSRAFCEIIQEHLNNLDNKPKCIQVFLRETPTSYVVYRPKFGE